MATDGARAGSRRGAEGALLVESALAIPVYLFFMLALLQIGSLAAAQTKVQVAVNQTAVEISQFSYARSTRAGSDVARGLEALQKGLDNGDLLGTGDSGNPIVQVIAPGGSEKQAAAALLRRHLTPAAGSLESAGLVGGIDSISVTDETTFRGKDRIVLDVEYRLTVWFFGDREINMKARAETAAWGDPVSAG